MQRQAGRPDAGGRLEPLHDRPVQRVQPFEPVSRGARIDPRDHHAILVVADRHLGELLQRSGEERGDAEQQHGQGQLRHDQQASGRMAAAFASHDPAERIQGLGWIHT